MATDPPPPNENPSATWSLGPQENAPVMPIEPDEPGPFEFLPSRYRYHRPIAAGGFGLVIRVWDGMLERMVAMKLLHKRLCSSPVHVARFLAEGRSIARLQHPGIVVVHDQGRLDDGTPWLTMTEVRGETFAISMKSLPLRRKIAILAQVAVAVAYAHSEGFVHRDLKPDNVMIGAFGEVLVMDWGLARPIAEADKSQEKPFPVTGRGVQTQAGTVMGSPAYMAPEQLSGTGGVAPTMDVYALGVMLYEILVLGRPWQNMTERITMLRGNKSQPQPQPQPQTDPRAAGRVLPQDLCNLCMEAMAPDPGDRPADAAVVAETLQAWLDGVRRRQQAGAVLARASTLPEQIATMHADAVALEEEALRAQVGPHGDEAARRRGWALEDRANTLRQAATQREVAWTQSMHAALELAPEMQEPRRALADHYRTAHTRAEAEHRDSDAVRLEALLRTHDQGQHAAYLRGDAWLSLNTDPPGAQVQLACFERDGRRLRTGPTTVLGTTPLQRVLLPHGSALLTLQAEGYVPVRYPVLLQRGQHWDGIGPGDEAPTAIALPRHGELGPEDVLVPAGWFLSGGDEAAPDGLPARRLWLDAFVIRRHPVTNREYLAFLRASSDPEQWIPVDASTGTRPMFVRTAGGLDLSLQADGQAHPEAPVTSVDWFSASAFAKWEAERTGLPWRLPHDLEWEKAARGVDGRLCPWGDHTEAMWACVATARPTPARIACIQDFPIDEGPYGVRGQAGNVRDWCANPYQRRGLRPDIERLRINREQVPELDTFVMMRGGAWTSTVRQVRSASRFADPPSQRYRTLGFRLCRSFQ
ncbi:MAG: sulfatase activating formylglycine-generating enzyme [Myxococcota bacterium]|jgi:formylglycine-generating enzyme required for sulfatase activity